MLLRMLMIVLAIAAVAWPLLAMFWQAWDAHTTGYGVFLSLGDQITWRTPVILAAVLVAYQVGRRVNGKT
jgi:hypothetical protein